MNHLCRRGDTYVEIPLGGKLLSVFGQLRCIRISDDEKERRFMIAEAQDAAEKELLLIGRHAARPARKDAPKGKK